MAVSVRTPVASIATNSATSITITRPTGTTAGDVLIAIIWQDSDGAITSLGTGTTPNNPGTPVGWTQATPDIAEIGTSPYAKVWWKVAGGSEPANYSWNTASNASMVGVIMACVDANPTTPIRTSPIATGTGTSGATTAGTVPATTGGIAGDLQISSISAQGSSGRTFTTTPSGMTDAVDTTSTWVGALVSYQVLAVDGSVAQKAVTVSGTPSGNWRSFSMILNGFIADPINPGGDLGTGTETVVVDKTDIVATQTDSGAGTDLAGVLVDWPPLTDTATGDDVVVVDIVVDAGILTDSATSTETIEVANFKGNDLTDSGAGDDLIDLIRTTFADLTDSALGDDVLSLEKQWPLTDSGVGVETMAGLGTPSITDSGVGSEEILVVDIPFTQVLPPSRLGNLYDLIVVARVTQQSGPPSFIEIDPIEWTDLTLTEELLNGQDLQASCQISSLTPAIIAALQDLGSQPVELWLYRNGRLVFAGPLRNGNSDNLRLSFTAKGIADYMRQMVVRADLVFKDVDQATIVKKMVDQHQATDFGHYGINTNIITPTGVLREITYLKTELQNVAQKVQDMAKADDGFDFEVDPETRNLQIWYPGKGIDKSQGEDAVVFDSRNITSSSMAFSAGPDDIATEAFGTGTNVSGDGTAYGAVTNSELMARYGRSTIAGTWDGVPNQTALNGLLRGMLNVRVTQLVVPGPDARDTPDSGITAYGVGDTVLYQPNELLTVASAYRIRKRSIKVTSAGQESVSLEFT